LLRALRKCKEQLTPHHLLPNRVATYRNPFFDSRAIEYSVGKIPTNSNTHVQFDQAFDAFHKTGLLKQASFSMTECNQVPNFLILSYERWKWQ
jgi:hypothetical protein